MKKVIKLLYAKDELSFQPPKLQSHRGYWVDGLPQNSLKSIQKAYELGYLMSEFDVRLTKDHHVVLFHDEEIQGIKISSLKYSELLKIQKVDTLDTVFKWLSKIQSEFYLNVEIKSKLVRNRVLEKCVLDLIVKYNLQNKVLISSFNPLSLYYFKKYAPKILRSLLLTYNNDHGNNFVIKSQILNVLAQPHFLHLDEKYWQIKKYKKLLELNIPIVLWTCNDLEKAKVYFKQGVYGIITDSITPQKIKMN